MNEVVLLHAAPHKWGPGKTHIWNEQTGKTRCGHTHEDCGGTFEDGHQDNVDCLVCTKSLASEIHRQERSAQWEREQEQYRRDRAERDRDWWRGYDAYLSSPEWADRRKRVLERARHICEGCGTNRAVQAHHLTYDRVGNEMLFDLVAVCSDCHHAIHGDR